MPHIPLALIRGELGQAHEKFNLNRCQLLYIVFLFRKAVPQSKLYHEIYQQFSYFSMNLRSHSISPSSKTIKKHLLECKLLHGCIWDQEQIDVQGLSGLQRPLRQPQEKVLVKLFVHHQLFLTWLV